jgi:hypothetical protein
MGVAGIQFGPSVANPDDRTAVEEITWPALILHPAAMTEAVAVILSKPSLAAQLLHTDFLFSMIGQRRANQTDPADCLRHLVSENIPVLLG